MCRSFTVFYSNCGHINKRSIPCPLRTCMLFGSLGPSRIIYSPDGICPTCRSNPSNPSISDPLLSARRRFFYRRGARQDTVQFHRHLEREQFRALSQPPPPGQPILYNLEFPYVPGVAFLTPIKTDTLPEDSRHCTICGGSLRDQSLRDQSLQERYTRSEPEDETEFPVHLPCHKGHVFGHSCIMEWFKDNNTCPNCRCEFTIHRRSQRVERPMIFHFLDGATRLANWADPILADLLNEAADGIVDATPEGFEVSELLGDE